MADQDPLKGLGEKMSKMEVDGDDDEAGTPLERMQREIEADRARNEMLLAEAKATGKKVEEDTKKAIQAKKDIKRMLNGMKENKRIYIDTSEPSDTIDDPADIEDTKDLDYSPTKSSSSKKPAKKKPTPTPPSPPAAAMVVPPRPAKGKLAVIINICRDEKGEVFVPRQGVFFFNFHSETQSASAMAAALRWGDETSYEILAKIGDTIDVPYAQLPTKITGVDRGYSNK